MLIFWLIVGTLFALFCTCWCVWRIGVNWQEGSYPDVLFWILMFMINLIGAACIGTHLMMVLHG